MIAGTTLGAMSLQSREDMPFCARSNDVVTVRGERRGIWTRGFSVLRSQRSIKTICGRDYRTEYRRSTFHLRSDMPALRFRFRRCRRTTRHRPHPRHAGRQDRAEPADERDAGGDGAGALQVVVRGLRPRPRQGRRPRPRPAQAPRRPVPGFLRGLGAGGDSEGVALLATSRGHGEYRKWCNADEAVVPLCRPIGWL